MKQRILTGSAVLLLLLIGSFLQAKAHAESCEKVVQAINVRLSNGIDERELVGIIRNLNRTKSKRLPPVFVNKQEARAQGWKPGRDLWSVSALKGASIGGDRFNNRERRLPDLWGTS